VCVRVCVREREKDEGGRGRGGGAQQAHIPGRFSGQGIVLRRVSAHQAGGSLVRSAATGIVVEEEMGENE